MIVPWRDKGNPRRRANATAKRMQQIVGPPELPTLWDRAHRYIDTLLDQLVGR